MILTLISPDKITLVMFSDFFRSIYSLNTVVSVKDINSLLSQDFQETMFKELTKDLHSDNTLLIRYKIKLGSKKTVPSVILDGSDYNIKFDIYSVKPEVLKALDSTWINGVLDRWNLNIEKLNK